MNDVLKVGIVWILLSFVLLYFIDSELWRKLLVVSIGCVLLFSGLIYQYYLEWKFDKNLVEW